ncbi:flagellar motor switch protein FliM [Xanthomonas campestris]
MRAAVDVHGRKVLRWTRVDRGALACTSVEAAVLGEVVEVSAVASLQIGHVISFKKDDLIPIVLSCQSDFDCEFIL